MTDPPAANGTRPPSVRRLARPLLTIALLGFAIHLLVPQLGELGRAMAALRSGRWAYLFLAFALSGLVFVASAWMVRASVSNPPPWLRAITTQVAAGFTSAVTPAGLGWFTVTRASLVRSGTDPDEASAATGLNLVLTVVAHVVLLLVLVPFLGVLRLPTVQPPSERIVVDVVAVGAVVLGIVFWVPQTRRRVIAPIVGVLRQVPLVLGNPVRSATMVAGATAQNLAFAATLAASLAAFGASTAPLGVLVAYMVAATVAAVSPTPGGLGAMEAALIAALTRLGVSGGEAAAATLAFRVFTFWIPLVVGAAALRVVRRRGWI